MAILRKSKNLVANGVFTLNLDETFTPLRKPPIVEAVIHWQARPAKQLTPDEIKADFPPRFPRFPKVSPMHAMEVSAKFSPWGDAATAQHQKLLGFRLVSETDQEVVQLFRDGVAYSVVKDYSH